MDATTRVILLGQSGFIGKRVHTRLEKLQVRVHTPAELPGRIDLTRMNDVARLARWCDPGAVLIMCAGVKRQKGDSLAICEQNVAMVINLCKLLQSHPVGRIVFLSSSAVYGEEAHHLSITEDTPVQPASYYGIAKLFSEGLIRNAATAQGTCAILRPPLVYGWDDGGSIYGPSGFVDLALQGKPIQLWGDGSEQREFVLIDDLVNIVCRLTLHPFDGILNIASGRSRTYQDVLAILRQQFPNLAVVCKPRSKQQVDHRYYNARLTQVLPDFAFHTLEEGVTKTLIERHACNSSVPLKECA